MDNVHEIDALVYQNKSGDKTIIVYGAKSAQQPAPAEPTEPGWYWFRWNDSGPWEVVYLTDNLREILEVDIEGLQTFGGPCQWRGPLQEPTS